MRLSVERPIGKEVACSPNKLFRLYPSVSGKPSWAYKEGYDTGDLRMPPFSYQCDQQKHT